ncbi:MAG: leucine-rich repeat protein [Clostridiales bacterium]|nr:leucine-rich repeat protein [Candidatus Equinaster intestinalis]
MKKLAKKMLALALTVALLVTVSAITSSAASSDWINAETGKVLAVGDVIEAGKSIKNVKYDGVSVKDSACLFYFKWPDGSVGGNTTTNGTYASKTHGLKVVENSDGTSPRLVLAFIYTIKFNTNGGTLSSDTPVKVCATDAYGTLPTASKAGFNFLGWRDPDGNMVTSSSKTPKYQWGTLTLTAVWEEIKAVSADWVIDSTGDAIKEGDIIPANTAIKNKNYAGNDADCKFILAGTETAPTSGKFTSTLHSVKVLAVSPKLSLAYHYEIQFDPGEGQMTSTTPVYVTGGTAFGVLPTPVRNGYVFKNWKLDGAVVSEATLAPATYSKALTLTATWEEAAATGVTWELSGTVLTIKGTGTMDNYSVKDDGSGNYITTAPWGANITAVVIQSGVKNVGQFAFYGCSKITSVTLADTVKTLGPDCFLGTTALTSISIPDGVTEIPFCAFMSSGIKSINLPKSVTLVSANAFSDSALTDVFYGGTEVSQEKIEVKNGNDALTKAAWHIGTGGSTGDCSWTLVGTELTIQGKGKMADYESKKVGSDMVTTAPWGTLITKVTIKSGVKNIGAYAFIGCKNLADVSIDETVTEIGAYAFQDCASLKTVKLPSGLTEIANCVFYRCTSLTGLTIPKNVKKIGYAVFYECPFTDFVIPDNVETVGEYLFYNCKQLKSVTIGTGVKTIGDAAFLQCSALEKIVIPSNVTAFGVSEFIGCTSLTDATLGDGIEKIGARTFSGCTNLKTVTFSKNVATIDELAFENCSKLATVYYGGGAADKAKIVIDASNTALDTAEWVLVESGTTGSCAWKLVGTELTISGNGPMASDYTAVDVGGGNWGTSAPWGVGITKVTIENGVTDIAPFAFYGCDKLESVSMANSVTEIGQCAFLYTFNLEELKCSKNLDTIGSSAFYASGIQKIYLPVALKNVASYAFYGSALGDVEYTGTAADKALISIGDDNDELTAAKWVYVSPVQCGDVNGDDSIDGLDVIRLTNYLANYNYSTKTSTYEITDGADADGNGVIDGFDVIRLKNYLANYNYETKTSTVVLGK